MLDAFTDRCEEMKGIEGVVDTFDPCETIHVTKINTEYSPDDKPAASPVAPPVAPPVAYTDTSVGEDGEGATLVPDQGSDETNSTDRGVAPVIAGAESQASPEDNGIGAGGVIGIAMAALVLLALLALLLRRRRKRNGDRKHDMEQVGDDTFMLDDGSPVKSGYSDEDSAMGSRFGMYPEGQSEGMILGSKSMNQDVHKCSSATCTLCETRRQASVQFFPIKGPLRKQQNRNDIDTRAYGLEDTVNL